MTAIAEATTLEVLRPLVGMDKDEITAEAERLGTLSDLDHSGSGLLPAVHAAASGDARRRREQVDARRAGAADRGDGGRGAWPRSAVEDFRFPVLKYAAGRRAATSQRTTWRIHVRVRERDDRCRQAGGDRAERSRERDQRRRRDRRSRRSAWPGPRRSAPTPSCAARRAGSSAALAAAAGIRPASIHDLYLAMGRGDAGGFTVPAINVRAMAYDTARAVIRSAKKLNAGAFIFEIARSEIGYTEQRPHEYAAIVLARRCAKDSRGPLFIQGDHVQTNAKKYNSPDRDKELDDAARADQGRDRRRLLQHRHRHLDAGRSRQGDARRAAGSQRHAGGRLRRVHPQARAAGVTVSVGGEIAPLVLRP